MESLRGTLRVALSGAFGIREVIPRLPGFAAQSTPKLGIELLMSDRTEDLIAEGADMALRLGPLPYFGLARGYWPRLRVSSLPRLVYLARKGTPQTPADLAKHDCILGPGLSGQTGRSFTRSGQVASVTVEGPIKVTSADGVIACAESRARNSRSPRDGCAGPSSRPARSSRSFPIINLIGSNCTPFTPAAVDPLSRYEPSPIISRLSSCTKMKASDASNERPNSAAQRNDAMCQANSCTATNLTLPVSRIGLGRLPLARPRQNDLELSETPGLRLDIDAAAMLFYDDVVAHRQAKPGTFARRFGREERVEYFLFDLFRDSGPVVANADLNLVSEVLRRSGKHRLEAITDFRFAFRRGVESVRYQIEQDPRDLLRIDIGHADGTGQDRVEKRY